MSFKWQIKNVVNSHFALFSVHPRRICSDTCDCLQYTNESAGGETLLGCHGGTVISLTTQTLHSRHQHWVQVTGRTKVTGHGWKRLQVTGEKGYRSRVKKVTGHGWKRLQVTGVIKVTGHWGYRVQITDMTKSGHHGYSNWGDKDYIAGVIKVRGHLLTGLIKVTGHLLTGW